MPDFGISRLSALDLVNAFTPRQRQVAELIAMGEPRAAIAKRLEISMRTLVVSPPTVTGHSQGNTLSGSSRDAFQAG
jgi:FixJ family two-component response regulator